MSIFGSGSSLHCSLESGIGLGLGAGLGLVLDVLVLGLLHCKCNPSFGSTIFFDVFQAGDQKFTAHRIVLAASIPYFHAMFTHDMMEAKQNEICMQGIEPR